MRMESAAPFLGMVVVQFAQVGLMIAGKIAMANGMTTFTFAFYSNAFSATILLPMASFTYRSNRPPFLSTFLYGFLVLGFIGFLVQIFGYGGLKFASATLSTSMLNLIPGFTFLFAVILRLEKFNWRSLTSQAKLMGTLVSIIGALILTLYQGPSILGIWHNSDAHSIHMNTISSSWILGGLLFAIDSVVSAIFIIAQALILKKCPTELVLMFFYSCFIAILSATSSLILERDESAWSLKSRKRSLPIIYSGLFGNAFQVSIIMWCVRRRGPLFASIFHPLGVVFAVVMGVVFLRETFYLGSLIGSIVVVIGFYSVVWGKAKETKKMWEDGVQSLGSNAQRMPLLTNNHANETISK